MAVRSRLKHGIKISYTSLQLAYSTCACTLYIYVLCRSCTCWCVDIYMYVVHGVHVNVAVRTCVVYY